jgi:hypothetical protein
MPPMFAGRFILAAVGVVLYVAFSLIYSQAHTSAKLAMQAANNATDSVIYTRSQEVWRIVSMASENIGRFYPGSPGVYFSPDSGLVYDSGTPGPKASQ